MAGEATVPLCGYTVHVRYPLPLRNNLACGRELTAPMMAKGGGDQSLVPLFPHTGCAKKKTEPEEKSRKRS